MSWGKFIATAGLFGAYYFCIFFAEIGVLNTNRTPGVAEGPQADVCRSVLIFS